MNHKRLSILLVLVLFLSSGGLMTQSSAVASDTPRRLFLPVVSNLPPVTVSDVHYMHTRSRYSSSVYAIGEVRNHSASHAYRVIVRAAVVEQETGAIRYASSSTYLPVALPLQSVPFRIELLSATEHVSDIEIESAFREVEPLPIALEVLPQSLHCATHIPEMPVVVTLLLRNSSPIILNDVYVGVWSLRFGIERVEYGYFAGPLLPGEEREISFFIGECYQLPVPIPDPRLALEHFQYAAQGTPSQ